MTPSSCQGVVLAPGNGKCHEMLSLRIVVARCSSVLTSQLADWKHYRYKVFDSAVQVSNLMWNAELSSQLHNLGPQDTSLHGRDG